MEERKIYQIAVKSVIQPPESIRKTLDQEKIAALAQSILTKGLLQPIAVRREGEGYVLVAGLRRLLAAISLEFEYIDAMIVETDAREGVLLSLVENLQREQLHYLDVAATLKTLSDEHGYSHDEICEALGISRSCLANRLRLNKLPDRVRDKLTKTSLTERHARALLRLDSETEQIKAVEHCEREALSVRQFEAHIDRVKAESKASNRFRVYLRDHRMLINAVLNTVKSLNAAGVRATSRVTELDDRIEVVVSLPLNAGKRLA